MIEETGLFMIDFKGLNCCSDTSISFHKIRLKQMLIFNDILKRNTLGALNYTFEHLKDEFYFLDRMNENQTNQTDQAD